MRLEAIYFAQEIKAAPLLTAGAIWYVALMVCCKQLQRVFSHRWTQQQLLSVVGLFTPSIHILWVYLFRFSSWAGQVILFNYSYSPMRLPESFILWSTGELTDGFGIQLTQMKNMNADPCKRLFFFFFFLLATVRRTGTELKINGRRKKKNIVWQCARWAIYEIDLITQSWEEIEKLQNMRCLDYP